MGVVIRVAEKLSEFRQKRLKFGEYENMLAVGVEKKFFVQCAVVDEVTVR